MVLARYRYIQNPDVGARMLVKRYHSGNALTEDGESWR